MNFTGLIGETLKLMLQHGNNLVLFQKQLYKYLNEHHLETDGITGFIKVLRRKKTDSERFEYMYKTLKKCGMLRKKFLPDRKDDTRALQYKEEGNNLFIRGKYGAALRHYTLVVKTAESSELLAVGYANRSAALYKLDLFEECVTDIDRALANNYSGRLKSELLIRKEEATDRLKRCAAPLKYHEDLPIIPASQKGPTNPSTSNCIEMKFGQNHKVIATRDIHIGDIILVESPSAVRVNRATLFYCHDCFILCYNPIPRNNCTEVLYCSEQCRQNAFNNYHKDECPILYSLARMFRGSRYLLALKMIFCRKSDEVPNLVEYCEKEFSDQFVQDVLVSAYMYDFVKKYTKRFQGENGDQAEKSFKDLVIPYVQICMCRITDIKDLVVVLNGRVENMLQDNIAVATFPLNSMFRHACCPNVFIQNYGVKRALRAVRTIKKGKECLVSYGPAYNNTSKEDRQKQLWTRFNFKCTCKACKENWPTLDLFPYPHAKFPLTTEDSYFFKVNHNAELNIAKTMFRNKISVIKQLEEYEPRADLSLQEKIFVMSMMLLGNRRMIQ